VLPRFGTVRPGNSTTGAHGTAHERLTQTPIFFSIHLQITTMQGLTEEQRMLVDSLRELSENEFAEDAFDWQGEIPLENTKTLAERGFYGINISEEYGGGGMTEFESMLAIEVVGRVCPDTAHYQSQQELLGPRALEMFGTEEAKEEYLPPVTAGEDGIAVAISEPEAGSDVKAMNTTVEETNDGDLVVNGEKTWVSLFPECSTAVTWVKYPEGLGTVLLPLDAPGIEVQNHYTNMVGHTQTHFTIENVTVPKENQLTRGREAFDEQLKALNWERMSVGALANGIALCALDKAVDYADQRQQFGQPIGEFQGIKWKLADMVTKIETSRALVHESGRRAIEEARVPDPMRSSIVKLYSPNVAQEVIDESLQIHGGNGYQQGHPLEHLYKLNRGYRIGGGTDEIQRNTIARMLQNGQWP
jgi:alkylation response protein AidB-like acyl-CoA dehydrogenase